MKKCPSCEKESNNFTPRKQSEDGLASWCRICVSNSIKDSSRTKEGLVTRIYSSQKYGSKKRGHEPPTYTKQELLKWLFEQRVFHELYNNWKESNYKTYLVPSVDRIDDYKGYSLDNIQLMTWGENNDKGKADRKSGKNKKQRRAVIQYDLQNNKIAEYQSMMEAGIKVGINNGNISNCCVGRQKTSGGFIWAYK